MTIISLLFILTFFNLTPKFNIKNWIYQKFTPQILISENYVFLGDSITDWYPLEDYYEGHPVVNSGVSGYTTDNILNNLSKMVYQYNHSKVFILIGTNDYIEYKTPTEIASNIEKIITEIKNNRPHAKIYVSSILPVNDSNDKKIVKSYITVHDNETIIETNKEIKKICNKNNITYIDLHSHLIDENEQFKLTYILDGLHPNELGYMKITSIILPYLEESSLIPEHK